VSDGRYLTPSRWDGPYPQDQGYYTVYVEELPLSGSAIAGLVLAILGICTIVSAPLGAVLGHLAKVRIGAGKARGRGVANSAIVIGWTLTGLYACCCGVAAAAFPDQLNWLAHNV
jgi:hypothetical protein